MKNDDKDKKLSYGIIAYNSRNIGDEIQSIASMRFLPSVDELVWRDSISRFEPVHGRRTKCILNEWWMWRPEYFPPSDSIDPLLISMHFRPEIHHDILTKKTKQYLIQHGPVGCRDQASCDWLNSHGIPAWFSGCLTLTLRRNHDIPRGDYILCVDVPEKAVEKIKKSTCRPVYSVSRLLFPFDFEHRMEMARIMLSLYHNACCCVSPRLHVITPCLAMETPVLRLIDDEGTSDSNDTRYAGVGHFFNTMTVSELMTKDNMYDFENPPANPENHFAMRDELIRRCKEFTGYDSESSPVSSNMDSFINFIHINEFRQQDIYRSLFFADITELEEVLAMKKRHVKHFDLRENNVDFSYKKFPITYKLKTIYNLSRYAFMNFIYKNKNIHYKTKFELLLKKVKS